MPDHTESSSPTNKVLKSATKSPKKVIFAEEAMIHLTDAESPTQKEIAATKAENRLEQGLRQQNARTDPEYILASKSTPGARIVFGKEPPTIGSQPLTPALAQVAANLGVKIMAPPLAAPGGSAMAQRRAAAAAKAAAGPSK